MTTKKKTKELPHASAPRNPSVKAAKHGKGKYPVALLPVLLITVIVYIPSLNNAFVWDDVDYIQTNQLIRSFNLSEIFSRYVMGNYHPLTVLAYAVEYHLFGLSQAGYHAVNLLLHLFNVVLVYYVIFLLSGKKEVAMVVSLLFGVHPIHVESIAWISELKDLLYTFFFLFSWLLYMKYLENRQRKFYIYALLLFLLSLLSKGMAASLPVVLLLTDYFKSPPAPQRGDQKEKNESGHLVRWQASPLEGLGRLVPFFLLSLLFGVVAVFAQQSIGAVLESTVFTIPQRMVFACVGFVTYLSKLLLPLHLSAFYPYLVKRGGTIPLKYYGYIILFLAIVAAVVYSVRRSKKILFGMLFFTATVFLVLQLLPVAGAMMADRYCYIPSIGIFYLAAEGWYILWNKRSAAANPSVIATILLGVAVVFFSVKTYARCGDWKNAQTLWTDVINQHENVAFAYYNRGVFLTKEEKYNDALRDYNKALSLQPNYFEAYSNRALVLSKFKKYGAAEDDYNKAIALKPDNFENYYNRAINYANQKKYDAALADYNKAIALKPGYYDAYNNRGLALMNMERFVEAMDDLNKAVALRPDYYAAYHSRGILLTFQSKFNEALPNYNKALELQPDNPEVYYYRGISYYYLGKKDLGCSDLQHAAGMGFQQAVAVVRDLCR